MMSEVEVILSLLVGASLLCTIPGVVTFVKTLREGYSFHNRKDSSYTSVLINPIDQEENYHLLWPRLNVWLHQISIFFSSLFLLNEIFSSYESILDMSCSTYLSHLMVIAAVDIIALSCDSLKKISSKSLALKTVWIPVYFINTIYFVAYFVMRNSNDDFSSRNLVGASFFAFCGLLFSLVAATEKKPLVLINPPTEEFRAGLLSYLTFSYINKDLVNVALTKDSLELEDVPGLIDGDSCSSVHKEISSYPRASSLGAKLFRLVLWEWIHQTTFQFIGSLIGYTSPLALRVILAHLGPTGSHSDQPAGFLDFSVSTAVLILSLGPMLGAVVNGQNYQRGRRISVRVGAALISLLYKKSLSVDLSAVGQGVGAVNNLISVDMKEIQEFACYSQFLWCTVFEAIICLSLLFVILGPAALGGIFVMLVAVPIGAYGTRKLDDYQSALLKDKDVRINVVQEAILGIRVVKWFAWEDQIMEKISSARRKEVNSLRSYLIADALLKINWGLVPTLVGLASFLIHTSLMGKSLSPSVGYTSMLLFNLLKSPVTIFPDMLNTLVRARVSLNRIQEYLDAADVSGLLPDAVRSESVGLGSSDEVYGSRGAGIGIGIGIGTKIRPSMDLDLDIDLKGTDADTLSSTLSHVNTGPKSSITITNATFGWAIQAPAEDDDIAVTKVKKGDWRFRFRSSTANPSISIASESERDDDESSDSGFDSDGDFRVGDGTEEELKEPEPSNQGRPVKAARQRNAWNRYLKEPADKIRSLLSLRRSKRGRAGAGQAQYGQLPSGTSAKGRNSRTSSKGTVDDCDTTVCGDSELSYSSSSNFTIEDDDEDDYEIEDEDDSEYGECGVAEGLQSAGLDRSPHLSKSSENVIVLRNISLTFPPGCLVAVCGSTGAGKSTLVSGLLGECQMLNGSVSMTGSVSYVSQTAWIQNASLRANILFGQEYEEEKYNTVVAACGLVVDLSSLPDGDMTDIGEKGVNLSGGQQQRISLARAAYSDSDIIILDDPLSAVDTHLGDHIFHSLIRGYLSNRTRVLVTNQVALVLPYADLVVCLDGIGGIAAACPPSELSAALTLSFQESVRLREADFSTSSDSNKSILSSASCSELTDEPHLEVKNKLTRSASNGFFDLLSALPRMGNEKESTAAEAMATSDGEHASSQNQGSSTDADGQTKHLTVSSALRSGSVALPVKEGMTSKPGASEGVEEHGDAEEGAQRQAVLLVEKEFKGSGTVGFSIYWFYISSGGGVLAVLLVIASNLFLPTAWFLQNLTLGVWMEAVEQESGSRRSDLLLYIASVVFVLLATCFKATYQAVVSLRASRDLHDKMTERILYATMAWFEATPSGRLINRFSQDISTIDTGVMSRLQDFFECLTGAVQVVLVISVSLPVMLFAMSPVVFYFWYISKQYLRVSRDLKRLESVNKSPVYVLFSETLAGLSVIRAFRDEDRFFSTCCRYVDTMNRCHFYMWVANRWLNCRTQLTGAVVSGGVAMLVVTRGGSMGSTAAGLALLYSMSFTMNLTFLTRAHSDSQMNMNSVERVQEYCSIVQEKYQPDSIEVSAGDPHSTPSKAPLVSSTQLSSIPDRQFVGPTDLSVRSIIETSPSPVKISPSVTPTHEIPFPTATTINPMSIHPRSNHLLVPENWPNEGKVVFDGVCMRYRDNTPPVLNGVSFTAEAGTKVGICGRSGAGKSSLLAALFRTVEPFKGHLWIDGIDVLTLPLQLLRSKLSIVPQDPILFKGSVRSNLDPFSQNSEEVLWAALRRVHMAEAVAAMPTSATTASQSASTPSSSRASRRSRSKISPRVSMNRFQGKVSPQDEGGIEMTHGSLLPLLSQKLISERGSNLSVGQRQLLCMARAILRNSKILIMDEATASVDAETDSLIQDTVRTEFEGVTVLSIAHRLHTIAFFDKVLVMDKGSAAEFDSPLALMDCEGSIFRSMCDRSGDGDLLRRVATGKSKEEEAKKALCVADDELREAAEATSADV